MSTASSSPSYVETPTFFDVEGTTTLFGIVTRPRDSTGRTAMIIIPGGGLPLNTNRNRVTVRACRGLAALGYTTLRMDYHGTGESDGVVDRFHLAHPFVADVSAGIDHLRTLGIERVIVVGMTCFGARTALATAAEREEVEAVVAMATPLGDLEMGQRRWLAPPKRTSRWRSLLMVFRPRTIRWLFDRRTRRQGSHLRSKAKLVASRLSLPGAKMPSIEIGRVSSDLIRILDRLIDRRVPVLFVYGDSEEYYEEFQAASSNGLRGVLERAGSLFTVQTVPGKVHGLAKVDAQNAVTELLLEWARGWRSSEAPEPAARAGSSG